MGSQVRRQGPNTSLHNHIQMFTDMVTIHVCVLRAIRLLNMHVYVLRFLDSKGKPVSLLAKFAVTFWLKYISLMNGRPFPNYNAAQLVLKYLLLNEKKLHQAWRNRIYRFSSGTTFAKTTGKLKKYLKEHGALLLRDVRTWCKHKHRLNQNACLCTWCKHTDLTTKIHDVNTHRIDQNSCLRTWCKLTQT